MNLQNTSLLPPLYFSQRGQTLAARNDNTTVELPSELLTNVVEYAQWGDLAKWATVQRSWSNLMYDTAERSDQAKWELAIALLEGCQGLQKHHSKALELLHQLANLHVEKHGTDITVKNKQTNCSGPAMKKIAYCYLEGNGVQADAALGVAWLQAAHTYGRDVDAAEQVARVYEFGLHGVDIDVVAAAEWFRKAAEAGHVEAMAELGLCYELGCGIEQSDELALDWYMKAAEHGHLTAKYSVGEAFEEARGVPQSDEEACLWYYKAAIAGDEDSRKALRRLADIARIVVPGVAALLEA